MDKKQIRAQLLDSLELKTLWGRFLVTALVLFLLCVIRGLCNISYESFWLATGIICGVTLIPYLIFCTIRTLHIFHRPVDYFFCRVNLCNPHAGFLRDSFYFSVLVEDPLDHQKYFVDTHAIFTSRGLPRLEDYVNTTVTIAHNRETGMTAVIG